MVARPSIVVVLLGALSSLGAGYRTTNFLVEAPTPEIAKHVGVWAEHYRRTKALEWLGYEMPTWPQACPLRVKVTMSGAGGLTNFTFDRGHIVNQEMQIEGSLERLIKSVLPHEITHTVFAHYFRCPVPRWADEGGSVLSEDDVERNRHDILVRQILNTPGRAIPLGRLFALTNYPRDVMVLYAEGYSVTNFLVGQSSRGAFLAFVAHGMRGNWDEAARQHYRYNSVQELEQAWFQHLRDGRRPSAMVASGGGGGQPGPRTVSALPTSRATYPPAPPLLGAPQPVYRGVPPSEETTSPFARLERSSAPSAAPRTNPAPAPVYGAPTYATPSPAPPDGFPIPPPPVRLLAPRFDGPGSPVGRAD